MNTKFYKIKKKILNFIKKESSLSPLDQDVYNIAKKLIVSSDTKLSINQLDAKYYIKSDRQKIFVCIEDKHFKIAYDDTTFYDITVSALTAVKTITLFNKIQQRRTQKMERDILSNVASSIKKLNIKLHE